MLFKIGQNVQQLLDQLRAEIPIRYRPPGTLSLIRFADEVLELTAGHEIERVPSNWFIETKL